MYIFWTFKLWKPCSLSLVSFTIVENTVLERKRGLFHSLVRGKEFLEGIFTHEARSDHLAATVFAGDKLVAVEE